MGERKEREEKGLLLPLVSPKKSSRCPPARPREIMKGIARDRRRKSFTVGKNGREREPERQQRKSGNW